ncbi:hypothetical protein KJ059_02655 [Myxococcota bacterium]|nr:hypothetical protein [Myxococcota bacterium]
MLRLATARRGIVEREIQWEQYGQTVIHPVALVATLAMGVWLLWTRRDLAILPIMLVASLIPVAQRIIVAGLDFDMSRILLLFGWARLLFRREVRHIRWCEVDTAFVVYITCGSLAYVIREGTFGAAIYRLGVTFDAFGIYFLLRALLHSSADVLRASLSMAAIACLVGASMLLENVTGRNFFSVFGGVAEYTAVRDGRLRCMGAFSHPIMAGSFGAGLAPIFGMLAMAQPRYRVLAAAGLAGSILIVITSASSGPALALLAAIAGCALFVVRNQMRPLRYAVTAVLIFLHVVREAPVWHLIGRASDLIGGTGYHRVRLISAFVDNWQDWFWIGTNSVAQWGWGLQDLTNQFVFEGVQGGIFNLLGLIAVLTLAFRCIGITIRRAQRAGHLSPGRRLRLELLAWGLGVSLATHCVSWISVSYFGQMTLIFNALLAFIVAVYQTPELAAGAGRKAEKQRAVKAAATQPPPEAPRAGHAAGPRLVDVR